MDIEIGQIVLLDNMGLLVQHKVIAVDQSAAVVTVTDEWDNTEEVPLNCVLTRPLPGCLVKVWNPPTKDVYEYVREIVGPPTHTTIEEYWEYHWRD